jgi:SulP family sulfate permease
MLPRGSPHPPLNAVPQTSATSQEIPITAAPPVVARAPRAPSDARRLLPNLVAGALCALVTLAYASSFAALIFGGALSSSINLGVWTAIVGSCIAILALSFLSSFPFALGGPDSNPSVILSISAAGIAAEVLQDATNSAELLPTIFVFLFGSAILCGLLLFAFGRLHWGRYVRYIPYPVVGGFLAGTGYLLLAGGWKLLIGKNILLTDLADLQAVPTLSWLFAFGVGLALLVASRLSRHFLVIPGVLAAGIIGFHASLLVSGLSLDGARAAGMLLEPISIGSWQTPFNQEMAAVRWDLLLLHINDVAAMTLVVLVTTLLNATSLDVATGVEADFDRELKALGVANILGGLAGGLVAVNSFNRSMLNQRAGANSPIAARLCAAIVLGAALFAPGAVALLPRPVLIGLVLFLGMSLLLNWLWDARRELPRADYLTVAVILVIVAAFGIATGVILGVGIASLSFVVTFSRQSVVKQRFTSASQRSNVERSQQENACLEEKGEWLHGFVLQDYIFFGTANNLLEEIRGVLGKGDVLLIDFRLVRGLDASAVVVLRKLLRLTAEHTIELVFTGIDETLAQRFTACGLPLEQSAVRRFADIDRGLEWAESRLLSGVRPEVELTAALGLPDGADAEALASYFELIEIPGGTTLFHRGEPSNALYLLLRGQLSVQIHIDDSGYTKRLRSYGPGTIVGEMGFYDGAPRSADIIADVDTSVARLSLERLKMLEVAQPDRAAQFHRFVIMTLAARLRTANEHLRV